MVTRILHAITDAASSRRGKFVTIGLWLVIAVMLVLIAPKLADIYNNTGTGSIPADAPSTIASNLQSKEFPGNRGTPAIIVFYDRSGLTSDDLVKVKQVSNWLTSSQKPSAVTTVLSSYTVPQAAKQLTSKDNTTMTLVATIKDTATNDVVTSNVKAMRDYLANATKGTLLQANVTGPAGIVVDAGLIFAGTDLPLLLGTVGLVLVLLILLYRSPILAFLPLLGVGWALQIVDALLGFAGKAGFFSISQQATSIMTVLLFGAGADYSIFVASRFREELLVTQNKYTAMRITMRAVGEAITSSAGTVILALLTLVFTFIGLYNSLGPTLALAIAVMLIAGLTLVPALLVWLGRVAYWPFVPRYSPEGVTKQEVTSLRGFWGRLGSWTAKHRIVAVVSSVVLLGIFALGNIGSLPSYNFLTAFRKPTDSGSGFATLQAHFAPGTLAPTTVLVKLHGTLPDAYQHLTQIDAINVALQKVSGVAQVQGPTRPDGNTPIVNPATLQAAIAALPESVRTGIRSGKAPTLCEGLRCPPANPQLITIIGAYAASTQDVSPDNSTVQFSVILKDDPYSVAAINRIAPLQDALNSALRNNQLGSSDATKGDVYIGGQTSLLADTAGYNQHDTLLIVPAVLILVGIILALLLRSLVAPLYLLGAVTLNYYAAIGLCGFFFQRIQGQDGFNYVVPLYTFIFLVALGADYTIFLMSRVREEAQRHGLEQGVPFAVSRTGGVITSAGLILAGTFAVLTTLPLTILYQFGVCVAVGILLDTFVVRGLLVPGLVLLLGKWNWWPGRLDSVHLAETDVEPEAALVMKADA